MCQGGLNLRLIKIEFRQRQFVAPFLLGLFLLWAYGTQDRAFSMDYGLSNDFQASMKEEFNRDRTYQIDNFLSLDAYRILGAINFHSQLLIPNDFNLSDSPEAQLTLVYLEAERLLGRWDLTAGRQFCSHGFNAYIGDGIQVQYHYNDSLKGKLHVEVPFDAENETITNEPILVFGASLEADIFGTTSKIPLRISTQIERVEYMKTSGADQILVGTEALARPFFLLDSDLFMDIEYETEDKRLQRIKAGARFYPSPMLSCNLEVERFDPDRRPAVRSDGSFFHDTITGLFSRSEIIGGTMAMEYAFSKNRELHLTYAIHRYHTERNQETYGHKIGSFLTVLSLPRNNGLIDLGYSGLIADDDNINLGILRMGIDPFSFGHLSLLIESGVLNKYDWRNEWILHVQTIFRFFPITNLETSFIFEENHNPYFDSDFRVIALCRLLLENGRARR